VSLRKSKGRFKGNPASIGPRAEEMPYAADQLVVLEIEQKSHDFRLKHETQSLDLVMLIAEGYEVHTNDIIGFLVNEHLKFDR
jgi:hypothetical protein